MLTFTTPKKAIPVKASLREKLLQLNPTGVALIMAAVVCYLLALQWGGQSLPWSDSKVIGTLVGFVVITAAFVVEEQWMGERALLQPRLFRTRTVALACPFAFFLGAAFSQMVYYIPIYFQSVDGVSARDSGVWTLALVIPLSLFVVLSGIIVRRVGYFAQNLIIGSALATIGCGLVYTLGLNSSPGHWIGYQIVVRAGIGLAWQGALISTQASVKPSDLAPATSMVLFFQTVGCAFFISAGECALANQLVHSLSRLAPQTNARKLLGAVGAANLRASFSGATLTAVLQAYLDGLLTTYAVATATAGIACVLSLRTEWKKINVEQGLKQEPAADGKDGKEDEDVGRSQELPDEADSKKADSEKIQMARMRDEPS